MTAWKKLVSADPMDRGHHHPATVARRDRQAHLGPGVSLLRIVRLASGPAGRPLEVNDTRMSGDEFEISYPLSRDASALAERE